MEFYADLHVHSKFSRATSRDSVLEEFSLWARRKGLSVVGTGDFTHPAWLNEIKAKLVPAEPGLFRLHSPVEKEIERRLPDSCRRAPFGPTRFLLEVEISTIYKKGDRTRKVHHVICVPDIEKAERVIKKLSRIGNLNSDGRPILGLDSRDLLEIALESGEGCCLIPAHIWTPWFSALGSRSGFDSVDDCYGDLASHIFAVETGLSSDPPMNWRVSSLDRCRLVSNSDAHSPAKLGREACVFDTELSYAAMFDALRTGSGYAGTVEFFPEEGKYHLDGHRACQSRLLPAETRKCGGKCPVCGKPVTVGVMNRVEELADRPEGKKPRTAGPFRNLVPLPEVLSEILGAGPDSNRVRQNYEALVSCLGPELFILEHAAVGDIVRVGSDRLAEAIDRMRKGNVIREAGYDGEYGVIRLFKPGELDGEEKTGRLFEMPGTDGKNTETHPGPGSCRGRPSRGGDQDGKVPSSEGWIPRPVGPSPGEAGSGSRGGFSSGVEETPVPHIKEAGPALSPSNGILSSLDPDQRAAAAIVNGPLLIVAGPGTGKTRTLTHRIAHLIADHGAAPEQCLAITFTNRAAREMVERLQKLLPGKAERVPVMTFHSLGHCILREQAARAGLPRDFRVADENEARQLLMKVLQVSERKAGALMKAISRQKRAAGVPASGSEGDAESGRSFETYQEEMRAAGLVDFDDLIRLPVDLLAANPDLVAQYRKRYAWVSVDEYQDVDECQYQLVKLLVQPGGNLCVIGDPDQAIYGFRGTDVRFFQRFAEDYPEAKTLQLTRNYRSGGMIVDASMQVIKPVTIVKDRRVEALIEDPTRIVFQESATDRAEAEFIVHTIEQLIGGSTFFSMDSGRVGAGQGESHSFSDFAVLYRTDAQAEAIVEALARSGMPFQKQSHNRLSDSPVVQEIVSAMRENRDGPQHPAGRLEEAVGRLKESGPETPAVVEALRPVAERCGTMEQFLSELAMSDDVDLWDPRADRVSLLTLHASKGLEFPVVFIAGCEDGILPLRWGSPDDRAVDEERRLFFVGMTRARRRLFLSHAKKREWMGKVREMAPSPFLRDIKEELLERGRSEHCGKRRPTHEQMDLF